MRKIAYYLHACLCNDDLLNRSPTIPTSLTHSNTHWAQKKSSSSDCGEKITK